jgi:hypothetical protein
LATTTLITQGRGPSRQQRLSQLSKTNFDHGAFCSDLSSKS